MSYNRVLILVDWNNVASRRIEDRSFFNNKVRLRDALLETQELMAKTLNVLDGRTRYKADIRLYDGWHDGKRRTLRHNLVEQIVAERGFVRAIGRSAFPSSPEIANRILFYAECPEIVNSYRGSSQKMVDTHMVADLFVAAINKLYDIYIIFSDDDDFIPAVLGAGFTGVNALLIRHATSDALSAIKLPEPARHLFVGE